MRHDELQARVSFESFPRSATVPSGTRRAGRGLLLAVVASVLLTACGGHDDASLVPSSDKSQPQEVRMTWFGISNWTFKIGDLNILMDGYMSRIPQSYFSGGGGGLAVTTAAWPINKPEVDKVNGVLAADPGTPINLILTGHSHFDHSFDTPYWAKKTGAQVVGSATTCYQVRALGVPEEQCKPVYGGETIVLNRYVTMRVVRWNHSGTHETKPRAARSDRTPERTHSRRERQFAGRRS